MVDVSTWKTFNVSDVIQTIATDRGISLTVSGVDDTCWGVVITGDKSLVDFLSQHKDVYDFQVIDGDPISVTRRAVDSSLVIDKTIPQSECKVTNGPAIAVSRLDVASLPRQTEIQYIDPSRDFATTTQVARHAGLPTTNIVNTVSMDFVISATQARELAFDTEYRLLAQQLSANFEHDDIDIEPGDTISSTGDLGSYKLLVQETTFTTNKTNLIAAKVLQASRGITIAAGTADTYVPLNTPTDYADWLLTTL